MRYSTLSALCALIIVVGFPARVICQSASDDQKEQKVKIGTSEVLVDVVVRDKKGRPVTGLSAKDFQITEDGTAEEIESFREVHRNPTESLAEAHTAGALAASTVQPPAEHDPFAGIGVVAMVFDNLSPNSRGLAREAGRTYVTQSLKPDDLTGVFAIGSNLFLVQGYTNDTKALKAAVDRACAESALNFQDNSGKIRELMKLRAELEPLANAAPGQHPSPGYVSGPGGSMEGSDQVSLGLGSLVDAGDPRVRLILVNMLLQAEEGFESLERGEQGLATTHALLSVIDSLSKIPGRKAIVFFSEGVAVPDEVTNPFQSVISAANRANVSIYTIDAYGLRAVSAMSTMAKDQNYIAQAHVDVVKSGKNDYQGPMTRDLERNEDFIRRNPSSTLGMLANQTGGLLIDNTNNLTAGLDRIDEDMRDHYELTYVSQNKNYDGQFRAIAVKVDRPGVGVQSRKGYYAISGNLSSPVLQFEIPGLAALASPQPSDFPLRVAAMNFPQQGTNTVSVLADAPGDSFTYNIDQAKGVFKVDFSIVALIKNESYEVVKKLSQHYTFSGPASTVTEAKKQDVLFFRQVTVPPGKYTVEVAAYDAPSTKTAVESGQVLALNPDQERLRLSSVSIIDRAEKLTDAEKKEPNPYHYQDVLLYPNLGAPVKKAPGANLSFFFDVYPAKGAIVPPRAIVEVFSNGQRQLQLPAKLPAADSTRRIQYASNVPLDKIPAGSCALRVTVGDGRDTISRTINFEIAQ